MDWIERLNRGVGVLAVGAARTEIIQWAYNPHLPDNVPHRHTFFEVCQVGAHGRGHFIVEGRPHRVGPGDVFFARPGVVHQIVNTARQNMELYWVSYGLPPGEAGGDETGQLLRAFATSSVLVAHDEAGRVAVLWQALRLAASGGPRPGYEAQAAALKAALLLALAQLGAGAVAPLPGEAAPPINEDGGRDAGTALARIAVRYIHDNLNRRLPVSEIAAHVHVSPRHLTRLLTQFTGTSPATYIETARLDRAAALLLHGTASIKEVAGAVGYDDVHHFTRVFARRRGYPPGEFRQRGGTSRVPNIQNPGALV